MQILLIVGGNIVESVRSSRVAMALLEELHVRNVRVEAPIHNIAHLPSIRNVLDTCIKRVPGVEGSFQASMILRVSLFLHC